MTSINCRRLLLCLLATSVVLGQSQTTNEDVQASNTSPIVVGSCDSTLEEANMMVQLTPKITFHWTLNENSNPPTLDGILEYDGAGWLGFGPSPTGVMVGSTAIIGLPGTGKDPLEYTLRGRTLETITPPVPLTSPERAVITEAGGKTVLRFVKILNTGASSGNGTITASGLNTFVFAAGASNELAYHQHRGSFRINLQSCDGSYTGSSTTKSKQGAFAAHGTLAVLAWGVATPFAMTVAWFRTLVPSSWIYIHVFSNVISFVFTVVAVIVAITAESGQTSPSHFSNPHSIVGVTLLVLMTFQVMNGFMRPPVEKKDPYSARQFVEGKRFFEIPRSPRGLWMLIHRFSGVAMLGMGIYQISSGLALFADDFNVTSIAPWFWLYVGLFVFFLIALRLWIMLEEQKARQGMEVLSFHDEEGSYDIGRGSPELGPQLM